MLENTNNGSKRCNIDEMVTYVFGELDHAAASSYERHLAGCTACSEEVAGFAMTRTDLADWRKEAFAKLSPLEVVIPDTSEVALKNGGETKPIGWIASLIAQIRASAALQLGGAFAAVALVLLFGYLAFVSLESFNGRRTLAQDSVRRVNEIASIREISEDTPMPGVRTRDLTDRSTETKVTSDPREPGSARVAAVNSARRSFRDQVARVVVKKNAKGAQKRPTLTQDADDDDTSLRLSELFDQIGG